MTRPGDPRERSGDADGGLGHALGHTLGHTLGHLCARLARRAAHVAAVLAVLLLSTAPPGAAAPSRGMVIGDDALACPAAFVGASVATRPTARGLTVVFTSATSAQVGALRGHLREVAAVLGQRSRLQLTSQAVDPGPLPPVEVRVQRAALGARVTIRALRAEDVPLLHALGAAFEEAWASSACGLGPSMRMPHSGRDLVAGGALPAGAG